MCEVKQLVVSLLLWATTASAGADAPVQRRLRGAADWNSMSAQEQLEALMGKAELQTTTRNPHWSRDDINVVTHPCPGVFMIAVSAECTGGRHNARKGLSNGLPNGAAASNWDLCHWDEQNNRGNRLMRGHRYHGAAAKCEKYHSNPHAPIESADYNDGYKPHPHT